MVRVGLRRQRGRPTAGMATLESTGILRNGVPITEGSAIRPGELVTLFAQLGGVFGGDSVRFTITSVSTGEVVFGPVVEKKDLFSLQVHLDITGPTTEDSYMLVATELVPIFPDDTKTFSFVVSASAPPPPTKPPGPIGNIQGIIIALAVLAGIVIIAPAIVRLIPKRE